MLIDPSDIAICVSDDGAGDAPGSAPTSPPIVQTSLFTFPSFQALVDGLSAENRTHVYTRGRNPTVEAVERKLAALERGEACKCFGSGMAAISAVMLGLLRSGDHILFVNQTYGPTLQLAEHLRRFGIEHDLLLELDVESFRQALRSNTGMVWLESPGTMLFRVLDIAAVTSIARELSILTCVDNSWATPLCQKPLTLGADIVVHSCTKYLAGHSDLVAGAVVSTAERIEEIFFRAFLLNGGILAPFDAWLLLRGLRTLPARLRQHEADALRVAEFLNDHPAVHRVYHPALSENRELIDVQLTGYSGLFSFELHRDDYENVARFIDGLQRFRIGVSWGGVESLVISPNHGSNIAELEMRGIPRGLIRLSVGLEGSDPLIADLASALAAVQ
jgi:cystathionine beta-lyase/cystathionine gamma-synthase